MGWLNKTIGLLSAIAVAAVGAELFLRARTPPEAFFAEWYTPGVHRPDKTFGFVFVPGYHGMMRHTDGVFGVPLQLDKHGFRLPEQTRPDMPGKQVVVIGGRSMMFCYGLPDSKTICAVMAHHSQVPITVDCVSWPGFSPERSFEVYRGLLEKDVHPNLLILGFYTDDPAGILEFPDDALDNRPPIGAIPFDSPGLLYPPVPHAILNRVGRVGYDSYLVYGLICQLDSDLFTLSTIPHAIRKRLHRLPPSELTETAAPREPGKPAAPLPADIGITRMIRYVKYVQAYAQKRGEKVAIVFIPHDGLAPDRNSLLVQSLPPDIPVLDLQKELASQLKPGDFRASDHYGPRPADLIGRRMAAFADQLLQPANQ